MSYFDPAERRRFPARHPYLTSIAALGLVLAALGWGSRAWHALNPPPTPYERYAKASAAAGREPRPQIFVESVAPVLCKADAAELEKVLQVAVLHDDRTVLASNLWHMDLVAAHYCDNGSDAFYAFVQAVGNTMGKNFLYTLPG